MVTKFVEMVNCKIESDEFMSVCIKYGDFSIMDSIIPYFINDNNNIHIKGEWVDMIIPVTCEISYNECEEEYVVKYGDLTIYFS